MDLIDRQTATSARVAAAKKPAGKIAGSTELSHSPGPLRETSPALSSGSGEVLEPRSGETAARLQQQGR